MRPRSGPRDRPSGLEPELPRPAPRRLCWILAALALLAPACLSLADSRPIIGVAFSGGGAKGCAHIGVLRVLEELRIPVDVAAGTSMGAIIGGLYSAGWTPDELETLVREVDWADALQDDPQRRELVLRRKDEDLLYLPDLELGIGRGGLRWPTGLRSGQKLGYLLRRLTLPVRTVDDFDDLPTPFRAVATDIASGDMVTLGEGDLARALRASMAIPTVFTPVEMSGRLLVDGGVSNNVPVDVVRAMGADIVIAIDIGAQFADEEAASKSFLSILGQTNRMITRGNMEERLAMADLVVTPAVTEFKTLQFDAAPEIIRLGEEKAREMIAQLQELSLSEEAYREWREYRSREPDPLPVVEAIRFEGNQRVDPRVLAAQVHARVGEVFQPLRVQGDVERIFGLGDFETVDIELEPGREGAALVFRLREKPWGPTFLKFGLGFRTEFEGDSGLALRALVNRTRVNALGGEWKSELQLGDRRSLETGFYQPLDFEGRWFVDLAVDYRRRDLTLFVERDPIAEVEFSRRGVAFDLGYNLSRSAELRAGLDSSIVEGRRSSGALPDALAELNGQELNRSGARLQAKLDTLDRATLPTRGTLVRLEAFRALESLGSDETYTRIELRALQFRTSNRNTFFGDLELGSSPGSDLPIHDRFAIGGLFSLSGYLPGELSGDSSLVLRAGYYRRWGKVLNFGAYLEAGGAGQDLSTVAEDPVTTATLFAVADSAFGPLYVAFSVAEPGRSKAYVVFGRQF
ncbi:MAG: patatin-like phospholipase family protein [Acidobacteriota bacterium]|nr:patatin-like phospholipase family protein [Acidobacteriota bacterium]